MITKDLRVHVQTLQDLHNDRQSLWADGGELSRNSLSRGTAQRWVKLSPLSVLTWGLPGAEPGENKLSDSRKTRFAGPVLDKLCVYHPLVIEGNR